VKKISKISIIFIGIVILISLWAFYLSYNMTKDIKLQEKISKGEQVNVNELVITETRDGHKYWEVYAKEGEYDSSKNLVILKDTMGNFYQDNEVVMSFKAPRGTYNSLEKEIKLLDNAEILSKDDFFITANQIIWKGTIDEIVAKGNVKVVKSSELVTYSDKSVFNKEFTIFKIIGNTKSEMLKN
jgi:LPS export ABC transporter protein LptC